MCSSEITTRMNKFLLLPLIQLFCDKKPQILTLNESLIFKYFLATQFCTMGNKLVLSLHFSSARNCWCLLFILVSLLERVLSRKGFIHIHVRTVYNDIHKHRCVLSLYTRYLPVLCEWKKSQVYYLGWIWTHDLCISKTVLPKGIIIFNH